MKVRAFNESDLYTVYEMHKKYFGDLDFPDFMHLVNAFIIEDDNDEIIIAGGVKLIGETFLITNKEKNRIKIGRALVEAQKIAGFTANLVKIKELIAFTFNDNYKKHLIKHGFTERDGTALRMRIS